MGVSEPQVSVVLPLYGSHHAVETISFVSEMWLQQDVPCEVVVASSIERAELGLRETAGRSLRVVYTKPGLTSVAALRNLAACEARAPLLYLGDGDIAPLGRDFLRRALQLRGDGVLIQPWMYRCGNDLEFKRACVSLDEGPDDVCFVTVDDRGRLSPIAGERFEWKNDVLWVYTPAADGGVGGMIKANRRAPYHWGAVLVERRLFDLVGGYCEEYIAYGAEDDDLLTKLEHRAAIIHAWRSGSRIALSSCRASTGPDHARRQEEPAAPR